ncbi:anti-sigma factor family protein [Sinomonas mesophila]|uniref:anti-sigma factor family protein n=1 Tax=Sinomonas mesophila TaxID=1531955 RepID=UPI00158DEFF0|nr:zf-HC2 domain-containing protein [Sinomonas mesophila]
MNGELHRRARLDLGAYVLGALPHEESRALEAHLAECAACRAELAALESLPALLDAVPVPRAVALARDAGRPPEAAAAPAALLARVRRRRRARRLAWGAGLAAAAAAFFAAGAALGPALRAGAPDAGPSPSASTSPSAPAATYLLSSAEGADVELSLGRRGWGTQLDLVCRGMPPDEVFSVWVVAADGSQERAAGWSSTGYSRTAVLTGATSVQLADIRAIQIRDKAERTVASLTLG